jgi:hypothetical protein
VKQPERVRRFSGVPAFSCLGVERVIEETYYTIKELSGVLRLSFERARQLVKEEPGVLRFAPEAKARKPGRRTIYRIPESVVQRILRRSANPAA